MWGFLIVLFLVVDAGATAAAPGCPPGTIPPPNGGNRTVCYMFVNATKTFDDAEAFCKQQNGHLASINDAFTDMYLAFKAYDYIPAASKFWIGARVQSYTNGNIWIWTKFLSLLTYTDWKSAADSGTSPNVGTCAAITVVDSTWSPTPCNNTFSFVCEVPGAVPMCDPGYTLFEETGMCYKLVSDRVNMHTFDQAEANCTADGGHLVSIHSASENVFVSSLAPGRLVSDDSMYLWIGLRTNSSGVFAWTDKTPFDYNNWYYYSSSGSYCIVLFSDGDGSGNYRLQWYGSYACSDTFGRFICKKQPSLISYYTD